MFRDLAAILGFFLEILFNPVFWAAIVLWIMYAKKKTRGLKKWAIVCTVIVVVVHLVLIPLSRYLTGYYQSEPTQETSTTIMPTTSEATSNTTSTTTDTEKQSKTNNLKNKFEETKKYVADLDNAKKEIDKDIYDLHNKMQEASKAGDEQKVGAYLQVEKDKCEEAINNLAKIYVPEIFKEYQSYLVDYYTGLKQYLSYMINAQIELSKDIADYDNSKAESLRDDAFNARDKAGQEFERVLKNLFDEADELGIVLS